jgi:hypothetical protein
MHEIFCAKFPCLLHEWIKRKVAMNLVALSLKTIVWDQDMLDRLKELDNKWTRAIDFWFTRVKE